jgi:hypothetical protein
MVLPARAAPGHGSARIAGDQHPVDVVVVGVGSETDAQGAAVAGRAAEASNA